jgi:hypothetical protein
MRLAWLVLLVILALPASASADSSWILALPPVKSAPDAAADAETPRREGRDQSWHMLIDPLDRQAPISAWGRSEAFSDGGACEDARLRYLEELGRAVDRLNGAPPAPQARPGLEALARKALGRCVPAFAFSEAK